MLTLPLCQVCAKLILQEGGPGGGFYARLKSVVVRVFHEINGFAAFERAVQKKQPKRVHYADLLQLIYVANSSRRIVVSADVGFLRAARAILRHRYPNVRIEKCSEFVAV